MPMILYCVDGSPPCRAVYLCLEALGLKPERRFIDFIKLEHLTPTLTKHNPQHTIPTLIDDDGVAIWDSHAINAYLVSKYGKDDSLYPKDLAKRALVDQRLHFDSGILFPRLRDITDKLVWLKIKEVPQEKIQRVTEAFDDLEEFLEGRDFLAGDKFTIADFSCVATVSSFVEALRFTTDNHPNVKAWLQRCKDTLPGYKNAQDKGLGYLKKAVDISLNSKL